MKKYLIWGFLVFGCLLLNVSCSVEKQAQWHLRKAIKKDPNIIKNDTLILRDTIIRESVSYDTIFNWNTILDTISIEKERLRIKIVRINDSIYIKGECIGDTVYVNVPCITKSIQYDARSKRDKIKDSIFISIIDYWFIYLIVLIALLLGLKFIKS
jgi:hypothetical protein